MNLINLGHTFVAFWNAAESQELAVQKRLWHELYAQPHEEVISYYEQLFPSSDTLEVSLKRLATVVETIRTLSGAVQPALEEAANTCAAHLEAPDVSANHIAFVGRFTANAWAETLDETPTCFYALEMFSNERSLLSTAMHETTHILHRASSDIASQPLSVATRLVMEGLAMKVAVSSTPGSSEEQILWMDREVTLEGQPVSAWLERCRENRPYLFQQTLDDMAGTEKRVNERYFGINSDYTTDKIPMRAGYYVAYHVFEWLSQRYQIADIARFNTSRIYEEVRKGLIALR